MDQSNIQPHKTIAQALNLPPLSRDFKIICGYQLIIHLIDGALGLFLPIFLLERFGQSAIWVIAFYILGYGLYGFFVPYGAMIMSKIGLKKSIIIARLVSVLFYLALIFLQKNPFWFALLAILILLIFRLFYWVPYHTNFAQITHKDSRGRQVAYIAIVGYLTGMIAPLIAGLFLSNYGFQPLFIVAMIVLALSAIPLFFLNPVQTKFEFSFWQTFKEWLKPQNKNARLAYFSDGAQDFVGAVIWPIFIYQLLEKQYLAVGAVSALIVGGTIIVYLIAGQYTDKIDKKKFLRYGSSFYSLGWALKTFVTTAFQIFVVGTVHFLTSILLRTPLEAIMYERAADNGSYVDEYTVLREISNCLGRVVMGLLLIVFIYFGGLKIVFILAALFSLLTNLL